METHWTLSMRQEYEERPLFLFMVVVGYLVTSVVALHGGLQYSIQQLLLGIAFGFISPTLGGFDTENLRLFSAKARNTIFSPSSWLGLLAGIALLLRVTPIGVSRFCANQSEGDGLVLYRGAEQKPPKKKAFLLRLMESKPVISTIRWMKTAANSLH